MRLPRSRRTLTFGPWPLAGQAGRRAGGQALAMTEDDYDTVSAERGDTIHPHIRAVGVFWHTFINHMEGRTPFRPIIVCGHDRAWSSIIDRNPAT